VFEVGIVKNRKEKLDEHILHLGVKAGFKAIAFAIKQ